jgi:imidazolonepropionase-like amidohydrolase
VTVPKDAAIGDASGKTILPGLWDMHVHTSDDEILLHRRRYDEGSLAGPRIVMAGTFPPS